jgi:hypothetical protein
MLEYILKAGDRVRMNMLADTRQWVPKTIPNGTLGTIIGKSRVEGIIVNRYPVSIDESEGIYSQDGVLFVKWDEYPEGMDPDDPHHLKVQAVHLDAADSFFKEYNQRSEELWPVRLPNGELNPDFDMTKTRNALTNRVRTGDLPETPFWELDIVGYQNRRYRITHIEYFRWGPDKEHCYSMEEIDDNGVYMRNGSANVDPNHLVLLERGNLWRERHGEPVVFRNLEEEISFETGVGRARDLRNPKTKLYSWTKDEALQSLKDGIGHGFAVRNGLFGSGPYEMVVVFDNPDLAERVRRTTLAGFGMLTDSNPSQFEGRKIHIQGTASLESDLVFLSPQPVTDDVKEQVASMVAEGQRNCSKEEMVKTSYDNRKICSNLDEEASKES